MVKLWRLIIPLDITPQDADEVIMEKVGVSLIPNKIGFLEEVLGVVRYIDMPRTKNDDEKMKYKYDLLLSRVTTLI